MPTDTVKIAVYETIQRTTDLTFQVPSDLVLPEDPQEALDVLYAHLDSTSIGSDVLDENITASSVDDLIRTTD